MGSQSALQVAGVGFNAIGLASLAMLLIFLGLVLITLSFISSAKGRASGGGFVLIGPFPIVFGTTAKMLRVALVFALASLLLILLALYVSLALRT
ncbi:MAG: DUF131 domain-containing protein [Candidatus Nezhaarchaeota archaeon]|nr:DUF131 domain-containing protein [Candidatus Nezhaarchaeota archaeon]